MSQPPKSHQGQKSGSGAQPEKKPQTVRLWWICLGLAIITLAVFGWTLRNQFINYDDGEYVFDNPVVSQGLTLKGLAWAFSFHSFNWHPLTWLSHMLDCQLYGLHPAGHHLTNVMLHTTTVIALFLAVREMTGAIWRSAFVAAVFAIHPLRVESVAWVAERKDVLSGLFFVLTIWAYARYARQRSSKMRFGLVMALFALGLMSKPMLVTLPLILLLLDFWPLRREMPVRALAMEKLPLCGMAIVAGLATWFAQQGALRSGEDFLLIYRLGNAVISVVMYLWQMIWPANLALFYPLPHDGQPVWSVLLAGCVAAAVCVAAWKQRRRHPWLLVGWLWYLVMLLPVIGVIQVGSQAHADRYTYLPQIGIYIAAAWLGAEYLTARWAASCAVAIVVALAACAWWQTQYWTNSESIWEHTLASAAGTDLAHYNLGNAFLYKGEVDQAIVQYQWALNINSNCAEAALDLGDALRQKGQIDQAMALYERALQIKPRMADARADLGTAFRELGRLGDAIAQYQEALQINPADAKTHFDLGNVYLQQGRSQEAAEQYGMAIQYDPLYEKAFNNLGTAFLREGRLGEAIAQFKKAVELKDDDPDARNNLAWLLATSADNSLRDGSQALELARRVNDQTAGTNALYLHTLAAALAETGRFGDAIQIAGHAIKLARAAGQENLAGQINRELARYQAGLPYHR